MNYWLIKSEPDVFGIEEMKAAGTEPWDGIRNYQARNFMRDEMEIGDLALFYHSNTKPPGVAGVVKVASKCYPDPTQFDKKSKYYDEKSKEDNPRWLLVDFEFVCEMPKYVSLDELKSEAEGKLEGMLTLRKGNRLSVMPLEKKHFTVVCKMGGIQKVTDLDK
ncbi:EVE domain-containing protein [Roseibacillus persicicus]|uniref:EVE domain-containing protein n=1 Tax=Roseibacillus persicicus TaxID=454148 RepID=A0A918WJ54_9BACT|nr:EVE domain-containing protein [Roseibacillus persicicus]GHC51279.1 EVE domain-containing protein [Roseibacillus persicicus]